MDRTHNKKEQQQNKEGCKVRLVRFLSLPLALVFFLFCFLFYDFAFLKIPFPLHYGTGQKHTFCIFFSAFNPSQHFFFLLSLGPGLMSISQFIHEIDTSYTLNNDDDRIRTLTNLFSLNPLENKYIVSIYNESFEQSKSHSFTTRYGEEWPAFDSVVSSFINICTLMDPWSVLSSFDLYTTFLNDLSVAFNNNTYGWLLSHSIKATIAMVLPWALQLDRQMFGKEKGGKYRLNYLAAVLLKIFNNIRVNDSNKYKKSIMLYLGNNLCYIYWKLDNPLLCRNIFSNMSNTSLRITDFLHNDQLKYRFYLARYYLTKYELLESFAHLEWCLVHTSSPKNKSMIIELLLPISLVLGKKPNFATFHRLQNGNGYAVQILSIYEQLFRATAKGDYVSFKLVLNNHRDYLKDKNLLLLLNGAEILIFRNYLKRIWKFMNCPSSLDTKIIPITGKDIQFVENLLVTLIDSNLVKGKLTGKQTIVLSKNDPFPAVFDMYTRRYGAHHKPNNSWM
ncbi:conserved hypothetical protein [Lodderomyces elongisporus NRRL YB-4239]|uniref:Uncharacterized protein n=1 Tax=Lodderomyces elongisporus (strain ATCC 11503 / CBS 2605 / JCM 1781 / NBRC 1676 / NRRL YB-4239) TaxID=379508 RepID=A5DT76_LODEL|nr:conserved hypothetical protein [Lodderomyces elongisporus NRRL YB-4239]